MHTQVARRQPLFAITTQSPIIHTLNFNLIFETCILIINVNVYSTAHRCISASITSHFVFSQLQKPTRLPTQSALHMVQLWFKGIAFMFLF